MKTRFALWIAIAVALLIAVLFVARAQNRPATHVNVPIIDARAEDVNTIEGIVEATYTTISGGIGVPRQWARERTLYDPNAHFVAVDVDPKTGAITTRSTTDQEFADETDAFLVKEGFSERELAHKIYRFGNVASVLSGYEGKVASTGKVITRGVNIFELYFDGKRWRILSIVWDTERPGNPIPPDLLPKE